MNTEPDKDKIGKVGGKGKYKNVCFCKMRRSLFKMKLRFEPEELARLEPIKEWPEASVDESINI
jgi:hypothetical protein